MSVEVVKSLNLDDLDDVEFVEEVEQSFDIWFGEGPLPFETISELTAAVAAEFKCKDEPGQCATSMAFYRLRRAVQAISVQFPRPDTPLVEVLGRDQKREAKKLEAESGLRIGAPSLTWRGGIGCLGVAAAAVCLFVQPFGWIGAAVALLLIVLSFAAVKLDPGRYRYENFGEFVRSVADQNVGKMMREGADSRARTIEAAVISAASRMSGIPAEKIGPETALWPLRARNAA